MTFGLKLLELLEDSVIVQSIVTVGVVGAMIYCSVTGIEINESIRAISYTVIGFWFGSKSQHAQNKHLERLRAREKLHKEELSRTKNS